MSRQESTEDICAICGGSDRVTRCGGCGRSLCKRCRSMEIYVQVDGEITIKYFCSDCGDDPRVNPPKACKKVFGLEDVTDMVNQEDQSKSRRFKIKLKMS